MAEPLLHQVQRVPAETAATPKPCRSPLGEAWGPSSPPASMTACTAHQPVMRLQGQRRTPLPFPRRLCNSRMPCTRSSASSSAGTAHSVWA